jgi:hypothetical protein
MSLVNEVLLERELTHGSFEDVSYMSQHLKEVFVSSRNGASFSPLQREALDMLASKLARILCGNKDEPDHWVDMSGYSLLVARALGYQVPPEVTPKGKTSKEKVNVSVSSGGRLSAIDQIGGELRASE